MKTALVNLDFATTEVFQDLSEILRSDDVLISTYHEHRADSSLISMETYVKELIKREEVTSLALIAPGFATLKFLHDRLKGELQETSRTCIGLSLPEFWMLQKLESIAPFQYESFYTYLSSIVSIGYPLLSLGCRTDACAEYFQHKMLGGFRPQVQSVQALCRSMGFIRQIPAGLG